MSLKQVDNPPVCPKNLGRIWESSFKGKCTGAYFSGGSARVCPDRFNLTCPIMFGNAPLPTEEVAAGSDIKVQDVGSDPIEPCPPEARQ